MHGNFDKSETITGNLERGGHMKDFRERKTELQLWPLLFVLMIAAFCFAFTGPIMRGRTSILQGVGDASTIHIEDEENPLASPSDVEYTNSTEDEAARSGIQERTAIGTPKAIGAVSAGVVAVAGVLIYLLKRNEDGQLG